MRRSTRALRLTAYALMVLCGAIVALQINAQPQGLIIKPLWWVMTLWLLVGGTSCGVGQVVRRWTGEFVGLPLAASSLIGFGLLQGGLYGWGVAMIPSQSLIFGYALILFARWRDVFTLYRIAREDAP